MAFRVLGVVMRVLCLSVVLTKRGDALRLTDCEVLKLKTFERCVADENENWNLKSRIEMMS